MVRIIHTIISKKHIIYNLVFLFKWNLYDIPICIFDTNQFYVMLKLLKFYYLFQHV